MSIYKNTWRYDADCLVSVVSLISSSVIYKMQALIKCCFVVSLTSIQLLFIQCYAFFGWNIIEFRLSLLYSYDNVSYTKFGQ